jgi:hypothetical protein
LDHYWCLCGKNLNIVSMCGYSSLLQWSVPKGMDHCSSEEYQCTHVDVCVARTWISYRCVPCHLWCTHWTF